MDCDVHQRRRRRCRARVSVEKTRRVTCDKLLAPAQVSDVKNVQVYGIVVSCQTPKKSSGTDHYMTMSVVDSHVTTGEAIDIRIFGPPERLPFVLQIGDIVRLDKYVIIPICISRTPPNSSNIYVCMYMRDEARVRVRR